MTDVEREFIIALSYDPRVAETLAAVKREWLVDELALAVYDATRDHGAVAVLPRLYEILPWRAKEYVDILARHSGHHTYAAELAPALMAAHIDREIEDAVKQAKALPRAVDRLGSLRGALETISDGVVRTHGDPYARAIEALTEGGIVYQTGFSGLDRFVRMRPGNLVVLAARPGSGKSAAIVTLARAFHRVGRGVEIFTAEMTEEEMLARAAAGETGVENMRILANVDPFTQRRELTQDEEAAVIDVYERFRASRTFIVTDASGMDCEELGHRIATSRADVCFVDYLQLIVPTPGGPKNRTREQEVGQVSRALKRAAKRGGKLVVSAAQLNRGVEHSPRRPIIADLRESGAIEQDMDVGVFLHVNTHDTGADSYIEPAVALAAELLPVEWIIAKNRSGRLGLLSMMFDKRAQQFVLRESYRVPPPATVHDKLTF